MKKLITGFISLAVLILAVQIPRAATDRAATTDATSFDGGNRIRLINVAPTTTTVVLLSSAPESSALGIYRWRERFIQNMSNGSLSIFFDSVTYTMSQSTFGIVLTSSTRGMTDGDGWLTYYQGVIYGAFSAGTTTTTATGMAAPGAGGYEQYEKK